MKISEGGIGCGPDCGYSVHLKGPYFVISVSDSRILWIPPQRFELWRSFISEL